MARRAPLAIEPDNLDPLNQVMQDDREGLADALSASLEQLNVTDQKSIKGMLYVVPVANGKWEWIRDVFPPFDMAVIMQTLKDELGGGDFVLKLMADGKPRKNFHFSIMKDRQPLVTTSRKEDGDGNMILFMQMMQQQSAQMMQMQQAAADRAAADRQASMQSIMALAGIALPLIMGGKEKTSDIIGMVAALKSDQPSMTLADQISALKGLKELTEPAEKSDDPQDMIMNGMRLIGPAIKGAADFMTKRAQGRDEVPGGVEPHSEEAPPLRLGAPIAGPVLEGPTGGREPSAYPIIDLIRDDVVFCYARNHDPEKAADMVYDTLDAHQVTEADINALMAAVAIAPGGYLEFFASEGIDLRQRPEWAEAFLSALVSIHSEADADDDNSERGTGGDPNASQDGGASSAGS